MAQTIGQQLQSERKKRGWSIKDVAHDTRIHTDTLRGLEADDYSVFSSTTYAKSFLQLYSRHLELDMEEALNDFNSVSEGLSNSRISYLKSGTDDIQPGEAIQPRVEKDSSAAYAQYNGHPMPVLLKLVVLTLVLIIPVFYVIGIQADSVEEAQALLKEVISSKGKSLVNNQLPQDSVGETGQGEVSSESTEIPVTPSPAQADTQERKNRFPRPLPQDIPASSPTASVQSSLPVKAMPISPKKTSRLEKTDTALYRY